MDYRILVQYQEGAPRKRRLRVKIVEEPYTGSPISQRIDRAVEQVAQEAAVARLVDVQSALYEVETPGRGMGGKDFVLLAVYLLVFELPVEPGNRGGAS